MTDTIEDWIREEWNNKIHTPMRDWLHKKYKTLKEAMQYAKLFKNKPLGKSSEQIVEEILSKQQDPKVLEQTIIEANIGLLVKMLKKRMIVCPHCGKTDLVWGCCGEPLLKEAMKQEKKA